MGRTLRKRAVRLTHRISHFTTFLLEEAEEQTLAFIIMNENMKIGTNMVRLHPKMSRKEYVKCMFQAVTGCTKVTHWLDIAWKDGYLHDQTYVSLRRECTDLTFIMINKIEALMGDLNLQLALMDTLG